MMTARFSGCSAVWLAHLFWEQRVGGSNPLAPTINGGAMDLYSITSSLGLARQLPGFKSTEIRVFGSSEIAVNIKKKRFFYDDKCVVVASVASMADYFELMMLLSALRSYSKVDLILLYLFYARQDKCEPGESIGSAVVQRSLGFGNINCIYHLDSHSDFFAKKNIAISSNKLIATDISQQNFENLVIVSPDLGGKDFAQSIAEQVRVDCVVCKKHKRNDQILCTVGRKKICGKNCIIVDDIIDTGKTIRYTAEELCALGASSVTAYCVHGVFSQGSELLLGTSCLREVVVTDSICRMTQDVLPIRRIGLVPALVDLIDGM